MLRVTLSQVTLSRPAALPSMQHTRSWSVLLCHRLKNVHFIALILRKEKGGIQHSSNSSIRQTDRQRAMHAMQQSNASMLTQRKFTKERPPYPIPTIVSPIALLILPSYPFLNSLFVPPTFSISPKLAFRPPSFTPPSLTLRSFSALANRTFSFILSTHS